MVPLPMVVVPTRRAPFMVRRVAANSSAALAVLPLTRQTLSLIHIYLVTLSIKHLTESQTANTTETIDSNSNSHCNSCLLYTSRCV